MSYQLREGVTFCQVDGCVIFLDVERDRYFRLPAAQERAFLCVLVDPTAAGQGLDEILANDLLVACPSDTAGAPAPVLRGPSRSALEQRPLPPNFELFITLEVLAITQSMFWRLRRHKLKQMLDGVTAYREARATPQHADSPRHDERQLVHSAMQFHYARRYVPIEPSCLLDSLSLVRFLARRRLHASIVFGVTPEPWAAHCWVQANDLALNETVCDANAYTPIRRA